MAYTQPAGVGPNAQKKALTADPSVPGVYTGRHGLSQNDYWGRFSATGFPISFDKDIAVDTVFIAVTNLGTFPGGACRVWIYESDANGLPRNHVTDAVINDVGSSGPGTYGGGFSPAQLEKNKVYWVISQFVLKDEEGDIDITLENFGANNTYRAAISTGFDPMQSLGWSDGGGIAFSNGLNPVGLYIDEIANAPWNEAAIDPLVDGLNTGFFTTAYVGNVWLGVNQS
jgi:hypothetical protein